MMPLIYWSFVKRLVYRRNDWKILRLWVRATDVCFAASRSRCYGHIFGYFSSVIRKWN